MLNFIESLVVPQVLGLLVVKNVWKIKTQL